MQDTTPTPSVSSSPVKTSSAADLGTAVQESLPKAIMAAAVAALVGASLWAAVTVATEFQIGWMAVGVGVLVGFAVRYAGKGRTQPFAITGAGFALLGCLLGNLLSTVGFISIQESMPFFEMLARLDLAVAVELVEATFSPMDLLFYAIAVYEGYKFAIVRA